MRYQEAPKRRTLAPDGSFGGMIMRASADDKVAIFGSNSYAVQVLHPSGRCVRIGWDGNITITDDGLTEV